ncbi:hypothetical protein [Asticcacaulis sp. 201]|uniref:hypothetical protein n=1 Tax=Asticcacaulis sp. 201 TaxID=3028787 RepID=UPI002916F0B4|nr:hypothetical protein [Asticcacaulis sp. 201]MDV6330685.1 hypothetical protein [Asticcacaulis sp. 201]
MSLQVLSVATRTDLKALSTTTTAAAVLTESGREGTFILQTGTPPVSDPQEAIFVVSSTSGYYWRRDFTGGANFRWFGADAVYTPTTNNWTQFQNALALCGALGAPLYIPEGRYGFTAAPEIKVDAFRTEGLLIYGDGQQRTILDLRSVTTSPNLQVHCTVSPPTAKDNYYLTLRDLGVIGQVAGTVLQLGADDFSDPVNMPRFQNVTVQNFNSSASCVAIKMNYVVGGWFDIQANGGATGENGGLGTALVLRQCQFSHFFGSVGTADTAIRMQDGVNASNVFNCLDMENVNTCVVAASGNISANTFIGGTWSYTTNGIHAVAGVSTFIINPTPAPTAGGTLANFLNGVTGLVLQTRSILSITSPTLPASGTAITNPYAQPINVAIWGGSVSSISINGFGYGIASGFVVLEPGDTIAVNYSSAPSWVWRA